ncbi:MAG: RtcB family protein [Deltaproteobacteria bacterium]|nr:RtcB family protein [Deltaproteobacteria bacterium]
MNQRTERFRVERVDALRWRVPIQQHMKVEGLFYADDSLIQAILRDGSAGQIANVASLPGIVNRVLGMPDIHRGYGFPIGGVAAFDPDEGGVVSPGGIGFDINCGVRLHALEVDAEQVIAQRATIADALQRDVPAGMGVTRHDERLDDLDDILLGGAQALADLGIGNLEDLDMIEDRGAMEGVNPDAVSRRARERGHPQLGSLGSGNHFLEIDRVTEIYDEEAARQFGLRLGGITLLVHSGSRGLGHQVCEESTHAMMRASKKAGIHLVDRQLACAPLGTEAADFYLSAMAGAANFAYANRALLAHRAIEAIANALGTRRKFLPAPLVYDVCHNIAKWETHEVSPGVHKRVLVHRKGATRAFGPGHSELPERYRALGQPVIIPGDMGRYSYVLCGQDGAMQETFGSACHGAGRLLSRAETKNHATGSSVIRALSEKGIALRASSVNAVVEEMPEAYKDVADVVSVIERAGIARRVAKLEPVIVVKG